MGCLIPGIAFKSKINIVEMDLSFVALSGVVGFLIVLVYFLMSRTGPKKPKSVPKTQEKKSRAKPVGTVFDASEVALHNKKDDCWIIVDNKIYDVTDYVIEHPGGDSILNFAGSDSSVGVHGPQHPISMWDVLKLYYIGELKA